MLCIFISFCFTLRSPWFRDHLITFYIFSCISFWSVFRSECGSSPASLFHLLDWNHRNLLKWGILFPGVQPSWAIHGMPYPGFWNFGPTLVWGSVKCLLPVTSDFCPVLINLVDLYTLLLASEAFLVSFGSFILVLDAQWTKPPFTPKNSVLISWRTDAHSHSPSRRKATLTFYVRFTEEHEDEQRKLIQSF